MFGSTAYADDDEDGGTISLDDRRAHTRYDLSVDTVCRLAAANSPTLNARLKDISAGGANLWLDRPIPEGSMICIDLPLAGHSAPVTVLACVMHTVELHEGGWSHGCTFSAELGEEELSEFGARKEKSAPGDNRLWKRFATYGTADYELVPPDGETEGMGEITNISPSGIGIVVDRPIEPGTALRLDLHRTNASRRLTILGCVVYLGEPRGDGWLVGCNFINELTPQDIDVLM